MARGLSNDAHALGSVRCSQVPPQLPPAPASLAGPCPASGRQLVGRSGWRSSTQPALVNSDRLKMPPDPDDPSRRPRGDGTGFVLLGLGAAGMALFEAVGGNYVFALFYGLAAAVILWTQW
jgi:hypothetical protein